MEEDKNITNGEEFTIIPEESVDADAYLYDNPEQFIKSLLGK